MFGPCGGEGFGLAQGDRRFHLRLTPIPIYDGHDLQSGSWRCRFGAVGISVRHDAIRANRLRTPPPCRHGVGVRGLQKELLRNSGCYFGLGVDVGVVGWVADLAGAAASATGFAAS